MKLNKLIASILIIAVVSFFSSAFIFKKNSSKVISYKSEIININEVSINVEIADTITKQSLGLGGRQKLDSNSGMLFPYQKKTTPYFWMKGMLIPIDIIWISNQTIVGIEKNVPNVSLDIPDNQLPIYSPPVAIDNVLEVNAGFSEKNNIRVGDKVIFN